MEKLVAKSPTLDRLVQSIFLRILTRYPTSNELFFCNNLLRDGFQDRVVKELKKMGKAPNAKGPNQFSELLYITLQLLLLIC